GKIGVGWATLSGAGEGTATTPSLTVADLDTTLTTLQSTTGAGSVAGRLSVLTDLLERATPAEADFVRRLLIGDLRQGALAGVMTDAVAKAADIPIATVRRAAMLAGDLTR